VGVLVGCGSQSPPAPTIHSSLQAFAQAASVHLTGTVTYSNVTYDIDLAVDSKRRASGTITHAGNPVRIEDDGNTVYMQGKDYFDKLLKFRVFDRWVKYPAAPAANLALQLTDRASIAKALELAAGKNVKSQSSSVSGVRTTAFTSANVTVQIPRSGASKPVEIDTAPAIQAGPDISQLSVHLADYGIPFDVTVPAKFVDSADSNTWPPYFVYSANPALAYSSCDNNGCTWGAGFTNNGGKGEGSASVHFLVKSNASGQEVGGCDAPLAADSGATVTASCKVVYDRTQGGSMLGGTFVIHNPTS
jgi:hypothetical protein